MTQITLIYIIVGLTAIITLIFILRSLFSHEKLSRIQEQYKQGKYASVIKQCNHILVKEPCNNIVRYHLGLAYSNVDKKKSALEELQKVNIAGNFTGISNEIEYRTLVINLYTEFNQPKEAIKELILLIKLKPEDEELYYKVGCLFLQLNKVDTAINYLQKTLKINPHYSDAHFQLGKIFFKINNFEESEIELNKTLLLDPEYYKAHYYLGLIFKGNADFENAIYAFEQSQNDQQLESKSLLELGFCQINIKNYTLAETVFEKIILLKNLKPHDTRLARYFLAYCFEKERKFEKAIEQWEIIYSEEPTYKDVDKKLFQYNEFKNNENIKDYLTLNNSDFMELCKKVSVNLNISIRDVYKIKNGCQITGINFNTNWLTNKEVHILVWFLRLHELVSEELTRSFHEEMKNLNIRKGILITNTSFTEEAINFVERRPIVLMKKDELQNILNNI